MRYFDSGNLSFSQIRIFLCAMESDSFTEAARKLSFTQSMVSKTIAALERDLGLILFLRQKGQSVPTPAARILYEDWKRVQLQVENAIEKAHNVQQGMKVELNIAASDTGRFCDGLLECFRSFADDHPEVLLRFEAHSISDVMEIAHKQKADVLITAAFEEEELKNCGYECAQLFGTELALFVPSSNPLAERKEVSFAELQAEKFIVLSPTVHPNYMPLLNKLCADHGFQPRIAMQVPNGHSFAVNLLLGRGIVLADTQTNIDHPEIVQLKITGIKDEYNGAIIAWQPTNLNARRLVELARKQFSDKME